MSYFNIYSLGLPIPLYILFIKILPTKLLHIEFPRVCCSTIVPIPFNNKLIEILAGK